MPKLKKYKLTRSKLCCGGGFVICGLLLIVYSIFPDWTLFKIKAFAVSDSNSTCGSTHNNQTDTQMKNLNEAVSKCESNKDQNKKEKEQPPQLICSDQFPENTSVCKNLCAFSNKSNKKEKQTCLSQWKDLDLLDQAQRINDGFQLLNKAHGFNYSSIMLTCLSYNESRFKYNADPDPKNIASSAYGLTQVTSGSINALGNKFQSKTWSNIPKLPKKLQEQPLIPFFAYSPILQLELGLAIFNQKHDYAENSKIAKELVIFDSLKRYRGDPKSDEINKTYANHILECEKCINREGGFTKDCLEKATN